MRTQALMHTSTYVPCALIPPSHTHSHTLAKNGKWCKDPLGATQRHSELACLAYFPGARLGTHTCIHTPKALMHIRGSRTNAPTCTYVLIYMYVFTRPCTPIACKQMWLHASRRLRTSSTAPLYTHSYRPDISTIYIHTYMHAGLGAVQSSGHE